MSTLTYSTTTFSPNTLIKSAEVIGNFVDISTLINTTGLDNNNIKAAAGIVYSKLTLTGSIVNADISTSAAIAYSKLNLATSIVNADISTSAAIAYSKLNLSGSIVNADVNTSAAIAYSKLNLSGSIVNADVNTSAAIAYSKLNLSGSIVNADVNASAAIVYSKLSIATHDIARIKLAAGTAYGVVTNDASGDLTSIAPGSSGNVLTSDGTQWQSSASTTVAPQASNEILNLGLSVTAASNILTVSLKQADGSTAPAAGSGAGKVGFRSSTATSGLTNRRSITGALTQTFTQVTDLGLATSTQGSLWVYLIDSDGAGTMKLGLSGRKYDEGSLQTTVAESHTLTISNASPGVGTYTAHGLASGDIIRLTTDGALPTGLSASTDYWITKVDANTFKFSTSLANFDAGTFVNTSSAGSGTHTLHMCTPKYICTDAVYTSMPVRVIGRILQTQSTRGNWVTPDEVSLQNVVRPFVNRVVGGSSGGQTFSSGTETAMTNGLIQITTTGQPVQISLEPDGTTNSGYWGVDNAGSFVLRLYRDGSQISQPIFSTAGGNTTVPTGFILFTDSPGIGTFRYKLTGTNATANGYIQNSRLVATEYGIQ